MNEVINLNAPHANATMRCVAGLDLEPDEIEPTARLMEDLSAEFAEAASALRRMMPVDGGKR
jgi:hypothetical protein